MKGELEKRMKQAEQKVSIVVKYPDKEKMETGVFYNTLKIRRMIDEARKEFPHLSAWNNPEVAYKLFHAEAKDWFKKYFGSQIVELSSPEGDAPLADADTT